MASGRNDEDRAIAEMLRACEEPREERRARAISMISGLVGAFAAGGVIFLATARLKSGWTAGLCAVAVLALLLGLRRYNQSRK
jgi:hypothetical protein